MCTFLPEQTHVSRVHLRSRDLKRGLEFYTGTLGLAATLQPNREVGLAATKASSELIHISEDPDTVPRPRGSTGLFHVALRYPLRRDLGQAVNRLLKQGHPLEGASDHGVSEAVYLRDPDGNGIELYTDRPRNEWPMERGHLAMTTEPLALDELLEEANGATKASGGGPDIGHVHLNVGDLSAAERFFSEFLGLGVTQRTYPGALFLSAGGYHHHIGVNVWGGHNPPPPHAVGLVSYRFSVPVAEILYCLSHRAPLLGYETRLSANPKPVLQVRDPNGFWLEIESAEEEPETGCWSGASKGQEVRNA